MVTVALVMLILTVNIDPTSPTMTARLDTMLNSPVITVAGAPPLLSACLALEHGQGSCTGGHSYLQVPNVTDSFQLSQMLLKVQLPVMPYAAAMACEQGCWNRAPLLM